MRFQTFTQVTIGLAVSLAVTALAQTNVKLQHDSAWQVTGRECTIRLLELANLSGEATGPIFLSIYARSGVGYDGVNSPGLLLARAPIEGLGPNEVRNNIAVTTRARSLRPGEKFTALLVERRNGRHFEMLDYVVYTSTYSFPRRQTGGVGSDDLSIGSGDIALLGNITAGGQRRQLDFTIERIQNRRHDAESGALRLAVYATPEPYDGSVAPKVVAARPLGFLAQGDFYTNLGGRLPLKRPGRGLFYLTLAVEEDTGTGYQPVAYAAVPEPRQF
jgi:hypothetical protein